MQGQLLKGVTSKIFTTLILALTSPAILAEAAPPDYRQQQSEKVWEESVRPGIFPERTLNTSQAGRFLAEPRRPGTPGAPSG